MFFLSPGQDYGATDEALLAAMQMAGVMIHNLDDKWLLGDQSDIDANAPQHLLNDIRHAA
jgi:hypothetical protein